MGSMTIFSGTGIGGACWGWGYGIKRQWLLLLLQQAMRMMPVLILWRLSNMLPWPLPLCVLRLLLLLLLLPAGVLHVGFVLDMLLLLPPRLLLLWGVLWSHVVRPALLQAMIAHSCLVLLF